MTGKLVFEVLMDDYKKHRNHMIFGLIATLVVVISIY